MAVTSEVEIMNSALIKLGAERIIAPTDNNTRALLVAAAYPRLRDALLISHPWKFCSTRVELTQISPKPNNYPEYDYVFDLPADCARVLELVDAAYTEKWDIEQRRILANFSPLVFRYIARITDVTKFDDLFCEVLAWLIASDIAYALTQDSQLANTTRVIYERELSQARSFNAQQGSTKRIISDDFVNARRY